MKPGRCARMLAGVAALAAGVALAQPGTPPDLAFGAFQRGYFITALQEAMKRLDANPKDAVAMTLMGELTHDGAAVKRNEAEAARWYRLAAELGDREGQFALGLMLLRGAEGVARDRAEAHHWFELAAAQGQAGALYNLGVMALEGEAGAKADYAKAAEYFRKGAENGNADAAYSFAVLERQGQGVPANLVDAAHWLKVAADGGNIAGQVEYAIMLFNGEGVAPDPAGAAKLFMKAAARDNPIAQDRLAHLYVLGRGVPQSLVDAAVMRQLAEDHGLKDSPLDAELAGLTAEQRKAVDEALRKRNAFASPVIQE